ncbi:TetR/AcrR family transcriptional regulator [Flexithrix dorotheae]|uniref:TetR/AcrR family transcriptional regulator n=1 Tax=Flexithrix dorotheae TaxID=70993 RepID=UPI00037C546A|nr:TetR/AcrR family transcriptional regulator [Flexithrix dorotheae]
MRRAKTEEKRLEVLEKGTEIMWEKGYNGTGIQEIVNAAGVPKGSFYAYFSSKEDFVMEAINHYDAINRKWEFDLLSDQSISPFERIRTMIQKRKYFIKEKLNCKRGCFVSNMCEELADVNEKLGQLIRNKIENGLIPLKKCLQEGVEKGEIRNVFDIDELANFIDNSWRGAIMRVKADQSPKAMDIYEKFILEYLLK